MYKMLNVENLPHLALAGENILIMAIMANGLKNDCFLWILHVEQ